MTTLWTQDPIFQAYVELRNEITRCESLAELIACKAKRESLIAQGLKVDFANVLQNVYNMQLDTINGVEPNTGVVPWATPVPPKTEEPEVKEVKQVEKTSAEEVDLSTVQPATIPDVAPTDTGVDPNVARLQTDYDKIDKENFKDDPVVSESPVEEKKRKQRTTKPVETSTEIIVSRSPASVKIFRRINTQINGVPFTNNEMWYEVVADTRDEALEISNLLRNDILADIKSLNKKDEPTPAQPQPTPAVPPPWVTLPTPPVPSTLQSEKDTLEQNYARIKKFISEMMSVEDVEVKFANGSGMLLGAYIDQQMSEFSKSNPIHK